MKKVTELTEPPIVGKFYLVPCVEGAWGDYVPIIGEPHTDKELFVDFKHLHRDVRFLPLLSRRCGNLTLEETALGKIMTVTDKPFWHRETNGQIIWRKMKCRREMPKFPDTTQFVQYNKLHESYIGKKVKCGRCPHRNMPLESLPQDKDGNVVCNGHGLKINMIEKRVVQRF